MIFLVKPFVQVRKAQHSTASYAPQILISKAILLLIKFKTPSMWNYFRHCKCSSCGLREKLNQTVPTSLHHLHMRILDGFPVNWHKCCIVDIKSPEEYHPH